MTSDGMEGGAPTLRSAKCALRNEVRARRRQQTRRDRWGGQIQDRAVQLPEFARAQVVAIYVSLPEEVPTWELLSRAWGDGKRVVVPCCAGPELELYHVESRLELESRTMGILEPSDEVRARGDRRVGIEAVDLVFVPGVAFDIHGGRLGYGKGYYDRLLARARPETSTIGLAFACQLVPQVPMGEHDLPVAKIVTESAIYEVA